MRYLEADGGKTIFQAINVCTVALTATQYFSHSCCMNHVNEDPPSAPVLELAPIIFWRESFVQMRLVCTDAARNHGEAGVLAVIGSRK